ncbi:MAG: ribonuclease Z [Nanoarchaeota archaeon]
MNSKLYFLGTSCMVPTKDRNHISVALEFGGEIFLFDCGEGTQNQIKKMKLHIGKISKIFISHWHGDHTLGLGGLIQTLSNTDNVDKIEIHGPKYRKRYVEYILKSSIFDTSIPIEVFEHIPKKKELLKIVNNGDYEIFCAKLKHSVDCIGYRFCQKDTLNIDTKKLLKIAPLLEKSPILSRAKMGYDIEYDNKIIKYDEITYKKEGLKISIVLDTRPCQEINLLANHCDYLVIEATYSKKQIKKAKDCEHLIAEESAQIALESDVKNLYLTHFSQRYKDVREIEEEAKAIFKNTNISYDFMSVNLKK